MNLTLVDHLTLLALDDENGSIIPDSITLSYALAGAAILELSLIGKVEVTDKRVNVVNERDTGDVLLDQCLREMAKSTRRKKVQVWIRKLGEKGSQIRKQTLSKLIDRGILTMRKKKILWDFDTKSYPAVNSQPENQLKARLHDIVVNYRKPDLRETMLLNLVDTCKLQRVALKGYSKQFRATISRLMQDNEFAHSVSQTISEVSQTIYLTLVVLTAASASINAASSS
jgi:Golgi phosphoprotein 3